MVNAFASRLIKLIRWRFLPKVLISGLGLAVFWFSGFHWLGFVLYLVTVFGGYFSFESEERRSLRVSFLMLVFGAPFLLFIGQGLLASPGARLVLFFSILLVFSAFLGLLFGFLEFYFENRRLVFRIAQSGILFFSLLLLCLIYSSSGFWFAPVSLLWFFTLFVIGTLSALEFFRFFKVFQGFSGLVWSILSGLLSIELAWILLLLPLGAVDISLLLLAFFVLLREELVAFSFAELSRRAILFSLSGFFLLVLASFFISSLFGSGPVA